MAALVSLLCLFLPLAAVALAFVVPSAVDLVRRDERVPVWWAIPLLVWLPFLPFAMALPFAQVRGVEQASMSSAMWATTWFAAAGTLVLASMALALPRGLRPEGPTERRFRTTIGATALLAVGSVAVPVAVPFVEEALGLMWLVPAAWGGIFWVLLLNRRGPPRLEHGRRMAATWLMAAGGLFAVGVLHGTRMVLLEREMELELAVLAALALGGVAVLMGALRALSGPLEPVTLGVAALSGLTLAIPELYWWTFDPLPPGAVAPAWRDLRGEPVADGVYPLRSLRCLLEVDTQRYHGECDSFWRDYPTLLPSPTTPSWAVGGKEILVQDGTWTFSVPELQTRDEWDVEVGPGGVVVLGGVAIPDRRQAHDAIQARGWGVLYVRNSPDLTVQAYLELCASSRGHHCVVVDPPPPPPPPPPHLEEMLRLLDGSEPLDEGIFELQGDPSIPIGAP